MSAAGPALVLAGAILAWRIVVTAKAGRAASRRWTIRTALGPTLALVAVDVGLVAAALLGPAWLSAWVPESVAGLDLRGTRAAELLVAVVLSAAVRRVPVRRGRRRASLYQLAMGRIETESYDRADDWIYRVVYPSVPSRELKPLLNAIRADLDRRSGSQASLDAAYVSALTSPGRTPSREDLRAACHRMLARDGRRRLARLVAHHGGPPGSEPPVKPDDEAVWSAEAVPEPMPVGPSAPIDVVRADVDPAALRWAGAVAAAGGQHESAAAGGQHESAAAGGQHESAAAGRREPAGIWMAERDETSVDVSVYVRADDEDSAHRVFRAVDALARIVGDAERG
jgi:hypothetical protein